jgi:hypothetical protein
MRKRQRLTRGRRRRRSRRRRSRRRLRSRLLPRAGTSEGNREAAFICFLYGFCVWFFAEAVSASLPPFHRRRRHDAFRNAGFGFEIQYRNDRLVAHAAALCCSLAIRPTTTACTAGHPGAERPARVCLLPARQILLLPQLHGQVVPPPRLPCRVL